MKRFILIAGLSILAAGSAFVRPQQEDDPCRSLNKRVEALINQYHELRERRRHLLEGKFDEELDADGGRLQEVLAALGEELGHPPFTKSILLKCLGQPDAVKDYQWMDRFLDIYRRGARRMNRPDKVGRDCEYLVYYWRGGHDFLFFISAGGVIVDHGWWFAYE